MRVWSPFSVALGLALTCAASAQIDIGTTDASDGDFVFGWPGRTFNLAEAPTGAWDQPAPIPGKGVYDPQMWAVVYKVNNLHLFDGGFGFNPHPSGCPVVFLVQGSVIINRHLPVPSTVGGFRGGLPSSAGNPGSAGVGLGGGQSSTDPARNPGNGSHATPGVTWSDSFPDGSLYGNPGIIPLVGGSGAGAYFTVTGLSGGGAILIACRNSIDLNSPITANGDGGWQAYAGSGGAIRLVANVVSGNGAGYLGALGGGGPDTNRGHRGGDGRIRIEANTFGNYGTVNPAPSLATVGPVAKLWPSNTDPKVTVLNVNSVGAPADPSLPFSGPDINLTTPGNMVVQVQTMNVPTDGSWAVTVRGAPRVGQATVYPCTFVSGNQALSVWQCTIPFTEGLQVIQARARRN